MEPQLRQQKLIELERGNKLSSLMAHPEWAWFVDEFIQKPLERFEKEAHNPQLRASQDLYVNIVRALEKVQLYSELQTSFTRTIEKGRKAQEEIDQADGRS